MSNYDYTVRGVSENGVEWELGPEQQQGAEKIADYEASTAPSHIKIFVVCSNGYLNRDGHSPVGKAW